MVGIVGMESLDSMETSISIDVVFMIFMKGLFFHHPYFIGPVTVIDLFILSYLYCGYIFIVVVVYLFILFIFISTVSYVLSLGFHI